MTIAVVAKILAQPKVGFAGYESNWYWIVNQLFREPFPRLPHYTRYHRILRNAERLLAELALIGTTGQPDPPDRQRTTAGSEGETLVLVEVS